MKSPLYILALGLMLAGVACTKVTESLQGIPLSARQGNAEGIQGEEFGRFLRLDSSYRCPDGSAPGYRDEMVQKAEGFGFLGTDCEPNGRVATDSEVEHSYYVTGLYGYRDGIYEFSVPAAPNRTVLWCRATGSDARAGTDLVVRSGEAGTKAEIFVAVQSTKEAGYDLRRVDAFPVRIAKASDGSLVVSSSYAFRLVVAGASSPATFKRSGNARAILDGETVRWNIDCRGTGD